MSTVAQASASAAKTSTSVLDFTPLVLGPTWTSEPPTTNTAALPGILSIASAALAFLFPLAVVAPRLLTGIVFHPVVPVRLLVHLSTYIYIDVYGGCLAFGGSRGSEPSELEAENCCMAAVVARPLTTLGL